MAASITTDARGQAVVELALTLPVLVLCIALIVTLSLVGVARLATENAASEGARVLAVTNDDERAEGTIRAAASPLRLDRLTFVVEPAAPEDRPRGTLVRVVVRYPVALPFGLFGTSPVVVEGTSVRRMEYVP